MIIRVFIFCFISFFGFSQFKTGYQSSYLIDNAPISTIYDIASHTSLKPFDYYRFIEPLLVIDSVRKEKESNNLGLSITPIIDMGGQYMEGFYGYRLGAGLMAEASFKNKFYGRVMFCPTLTSGFRPLEYFNSNSTSGKNRMVYTTRARFCYKPNEVFSFHAGLDNNFIGEGSRSLFLSDYGRPSPFAQMRAKFWRIQYMVQYNFLREREQDDWKSKYMASHHISWNITKWLNLGIFETVIFKPRDTLLNRGFDVEYLNPMVFF